MDCDNSIYFKDKMYTTSDNKSKCYCNSNSLDYYHEMEGYKSKLKESHNIIIKQDAELSLMREQCRKEVLKLNDDISKYKEKFERLHESHKRISRLNHDLEERTLLIIDKFNSEKLELQNSNQEILSKYQASQNYMSELQAECERYRNDCMVAVQLLQNNPSHFLTRSIDTLPLDLKERLTYLQRDIEFGESFGNKISPDDSHTNDQSKSYVPILTYPPTAMIFSDLSKKKATNDRRLVCPSTLAEILHPDNKSANNQNSLQSKIYRRK